MTAADMERFLTMCLALTSEHDREALLSSILDTAMDLSNCDAGTLYLLEDDGLHFCRMVTRSMGIRQGGHDAPPPPSTPNTSALGSPSTNSPSTSPTCAPTPISTSQAPSATTP